jgi:hypothetical protein
MAVTIKRARYTGWACGVLALSGFLLAPPVWPALGIATFCGVLSGYILIRAFKERGRYTPMLPIGCSQRAIA